jgi:phosphoglycerate dehydrogenase-like enzyme
MSETVHDAEHAIAVIAFTPHLGSWNDSRKSAKAVRETIRKAIAGLRRGLHA